MRTIPSHITLHYERAPTFQRAPELLNDVVPLGGTRLSRDWVVVGRADVIEAIIDNGGETVIEVGGQQWPNVRRRTQHKSESRVTLVGIVGIRYVNHREHGRTRYLAASVKRATEQEKMAWYRSRQHPSGQTPRT